MGALLKALSRPSAYAAKKTPLWDELCDRIAGALCPRDLDIIEVWCEINELNIPGGWVEPIDELIEKRRAELRDEDISQIMLDKYDF
jgi:hypothetical protein